MKNLQLILLPKHIIDLLHLVLIKKFPNIAHVDNKIQRLLISSLLSEQFQSFLKSPPFSMFGKKIYKIKIIPWCDSVFVPSDGSTSKRFLLILSPSNTLPFSDSAAHPLYSKLKLIDVCLSGKSSKRSFLWAFLSSMYLNDCLYYSGLCTTCSALSSVIQVNGYIKL